MKHVPIDDLSPGDWITVRTGRVHQCPCGCETPLAGEAYSNLKGLPLAVLAIHLPYVVTSLGSQRVVLDSRDCRVMRVGAEYVAAFGIEVKEDSAETPEKEAPGGS